MFLNAVCAGLGMHIDYMKKLIALFLCIFSVLFVSAQTPLSASKQKQIIEKIDRSVASLKTMQCQFKQVKSVAMMKNSISSNGIMYFQKPDRLRWQYTSPYAYTLILDKGTAYMKSAKATTTIDVSKNKMFQQILNVIMDCVTGGNLARTTYFKVAVYQNGNNVYANLTPQKKELKQLYSLITLHFNTSLTMVNKVEMKEKNGDKTTITLSDIKTNTNIDDKVFSSH